ncbi:hypothetical protein IC582_020509 [Cucumis melo]
MTELCFLEQKKSSCPCWDSEDVENHLLRMILTYQSRQCAMMFWQL